MMQHVNIIPVGIGYQTMSDGADVLWHQISNQYIIMGTIYQDEASSIKKSANGEYQPPQIPRFPPLALFKHRHEEKKFT